MAGQVTDEEHLFRRIRGSVADQTCYQTVGNRVVFSQSAFNDPDKEPSVDRTSLRSDPHLSRFVREDGIVTLGVEQVRKIGPIDKLTDRGKPAKDSQGKRIAYRVDVVPKPRWGNCPHALILMVPSAAGAGAFKRLKEALARLASDAGWTIQPQVPIPQPRENPFRDAIRCLGGRFVGRL